MKSSKFYAAFAVMLLLFGCNGQDNKNNNTTVVVTTTPILPKYGYFRPLKETVPSATQFSTISVLPLSGNPSIVMSFPRMGHKAIMLSDGKIMLIGGEVIDSNKGLWPDYSIADFFDPVTERFSTSGTPAKLFHMVSPSASFAMTKITDGIYAGKILIAGASIKEYGGFFELYDPTTDTYELPLQPILHATTLGDGVSVDAVFYIGDNKALLCGSRRYNEGNANQWQIVNLYDFVLTPVTGSPAAIRAGYIKTTSGDIVIMGGTNQLFPANPSNLDSFVLYDDVYLFKPATVTFSRIGNLNTSRAAFGLTLVDGNKIGIYGGMVLPQSSINPGGVKSSSIEVYDLNTNFSTNSTNLISPRWYQTSIHLQNKFVLNAGGSDSAGGVTSTEFIQNPYTGETGSTGNLNTPRRFYSAITLNNGTVLISGGETGVANGQLNTAEIYDPQTKLTLSFKSENMKKATTMQFNVTYAAGVTWSCGSDPLDGVIDENGLYTAPVRSRIVTIKATAKDSLLSAEVRITVE